MIGGSSPWNVEAQRNVVVHCVHLGHHQGGVTAELQEEEWKREVTVGIKNTKAMKMKEITEQGGDVDADEDEVPWLPAPGTLAPVWCSEDKLGSRTEAGRPCQGP